MIFSNYSLDTKLALALSAARRVDTDSLIGATDRRILEALTKTGQDFCEVRRATLIDKGQLSRSLDDLVQRGLVLSRSSDQRRHVRLSAAGARAKHAAILARSAVDASLLKLLTPPEVEALPAILFKLSQA